MHKWRPDDPLGTARHAPSKSFASGGSCSKLASSIPSVRRDWLARVSIGRIGKKKQASIVRNMRTVTPHLEPRTTSAEGVDTSVHDRTSVALVFLRVFELRLWFDCTIPYDAMWKRETRVRGCSLTLEKSVGTVNVALYYEQ